jgi:hypothetical protein
LATRAFCNNVDLSEMVGRVILNAPRGVTRRFDKDIEPYLNTYIQDAICLRILALCEIDSLQSEVMRCAFSCDWCD